MIAPTIAEDVKKPLNCNSSYRANRGERRHHSPLWGLLKKSAWYPCKLRFCRDRPPCLSWVGTTTGGRTNPRRGCPYISKDCLSGCDFSPFTRTANFEMARFCSSFRRKPESIFMILLSFLHLIPTRGRSNATEEGAYAAPESGTDKVDIYVGVSIFPERE